MEITRERDESVTVREETQQYVIDVSNLNVNFGRHHVLKDISLHIEPRNVTVIMGPSGCGKSTFVRTLNRMNDHVSDFHVSGKVEFNGVDIYSKDVDPTLLRLKVGMVFQKPNPFPMSIYENVAFGPKIHKMCSTKQLLDDSVKRSLEQAALWDEVKDRLKEDALKLSGGQQQRLCIARALAVNPEIILFDEPASALDPGSTAKIEELIVELKKNYTVVLVTHNMQQAARVGNTVIFLYGGGIVEIGKVPKIFENPANKLTEKYIRGELV
ncbi:MAG: phosphate ABC transporter ATP-binding protein [Nitrososphaerota archaeon]|nr:phosphate ABC transporter ATP-binding protein [Nitrososphaerota archaeon]